MNKLQTLIIFLFFLPISGMDKDSLPELEHKTLKQIIARHIHDPQSIKKELEKYPTHTILKLRYGPYNNILHGIIKTLAQKKDSFENFDQLIEDYKPLLAWLVEIGLDINEVNDNHHTPLMFAYRAQIIKDFKEEGNSLQPLINFLEFKLRANPSYFSLAPEWRLCKTMLREFLTCQRCKHKYT